MAPPEWERQAEARVFGHPVPVTIEGGQGALHPGLDLGICPADEVEGPRVIPSAPGSGEDGFIDLPETDVLAMTLGVVLRGRMEVLFLTGEEPEALEQTNQHRGPGPVHPDDEQPHESV